jgi:hypothetical protein
VQHCNEQDLLIYCLFTGIFLVAELVWINLSGQTSIESLEQEMDSLPTDLDKLDEACVSNSIIFPIYAHSALDMQE